MVVYGIASLSHDIADFYATAEEAKAALVQVFADEPQLAGVL